MTDSRTTAGKLKTLRGLIAQSHAPLGQAPIDATHEAGRLTARERIETLCDPGSFVEIDALARHRATAFAMNKIRPLTDGVITGYGTIEGRKVCLISQDPTIFDGQLGEVYGEKVLKVMDLAIKTGVPIISLCDGGAHGSGPRIQEGIISLDMYARIVARHTRASGVIPQIAVLFGPTTGAALYTPALSDIVITVNSDFTAEVENPAHALGEGTVHHTAPTEADAMNYLKELLSFLPTNNRGEAPRMLADPFEGSIEENITDTDLTLDKVIPDSPTDVFDITTVFRTIIDDGAFVELQPEFAPTILVGFARIEGRSVGIIANQPLVDGGVLTVDAAEKAARFIRLCDTYNVPILEFVDAIDFPNEVARRSAKLGFAYAEATVGKITVVVRHAVGNAYALMGSKGLGADLVFAWPTARIAVATAQDAVSALVAEPTDALVAEYEENYLSPYGAAERGLVDAVIIPSTTRGQLIEGLRLLNRKVDQLPAKKHGISPM